MEPNRDPLIEQVHLSDESVAGYIDSMLKDDLSSIGKETLDHVENCPACKDRILDIFMFLNSKHYPAPVNSLPGFLKSAEDKSQIRIVPHYMRRVAAIFFFLTLFLSVYFLFYTGGDFSLDDSSSGQINNEQLISGTSKDGFQASTKKGLKEQAVKPAKTEKRQGRGETVSSKKENFRVNPNLESMIGSKFRSSTVQVLSPRNYQAYGRDVVFSWEEYKRKPLTLKILNNRNVTIFQYNLAENESRFEFNKKLNPGLYYWKLECRHDLLFVGNFYIRLADQKSTE